MFGPDTSLVMDALQIGAIAIAAGVGGTLLLIRRRRARPADRPGGEKHPLEERVRVLERIATDRSSDLADEIEALRDGDVIVHTRGKETA